MARRGRDGPYVHDNGQDDGAEDEVEIHEQDAMRGGRWNEMRGVYSVTMGEENEGTEEKTKGRRVEVFVVCQ